MSNFLKDQYIAVQRTSVGNLAARSATLPHSALSSARKRASRETSHFTYRGLHSRGEIRYAKQFIPDVEFGYPALTAIVTDRARYSELSRLLRPTCLRPLAAHCVCVCDFPPKSPQDPAPENTQNTPENTLDALPSNARNTPQARRMCLQ